MVRAVVVSHPEDWCWSGYHEMQKRPQRYAVIDSEALLELFGVNQFEQYQQIHKDWLVSALKVEKHKRVTAWTQNLAVGSQDYIEKVKSDLGTAVKYREVKADDIARYTLKEPVMSYRVHLGPEKGALSDDNNVLLE
ncbi:MAG: hypothetical protein KAT61_08465 [Gammaproteobacteria bacterium]|nr:hypothetical protein [Gammaproteobacteria bacterium]